MSGYVPDGADLLTPYGCPRGAARAIRWSADVFGAKERHERHVGADGRVGHALPDIEGAQLMLSDGHPDSGVDAPPVVLAELVDPFGLHWTLATAPR